MMRCTLDNPSLVKQEFSSSIPCFVFPSIRCELFVSKLKPSHKDPARGLNLGKLKDLITDSDITRRIQVENWLKFYRHGCYGLI